MNASQLSPARPGFAVAADDHFTVGTEQGSKGGVRGEIGGHG